MKKITLVLMLSAILAGCSSSPSQPVNPSQPVVKRDPLLEEGENYLLQNDLVNAEKSFRLAAKNGNPAGIIGLGLIAHRQGNLQQEENYYKQAYDRGNIFAGYKLAKFYMKTLSPRNCHLGIVYLVEAGLKGNVDALDSLKNEFGAYPSTFYDSKGVGYHLDKIPDQYLIFIMNRHEAGSGDAYARNIKNKLIQKCQIIDWSL